MTRRYAYAKMETMKKRSTTPISKSLAMRGSLLAIAILMVATAPVALFGNFAGARDFDAEIRAVQRQIDQYAAEASRLSAEADTLQNKVAQYNSEKAAMQSQIDLTQAEHDQLVVEIKDTEEKILENQNTIGKIIADMYVDDDISPLEMLASSRTIADYVDKQTQRSSSRDSLSVKVKETKALKVELEDKKELVKQKLDDLTNQRNVLAAKEAEQQSLLDSTRGQEVAYQQLSAEGKAKRDSIMREQQAAIDAAMRAAGGGGHAVAGDPNKGGYPANLANSNYYAPVVDPWGMYSRQCVSYTAWKVYQKNGNMPYWGGVGNANQWPDNARRAGIPVNRTPRAGSVGVIMAGQYGHVVWVEGVNPNGTINVSQYNYFNAGGPGWGHYSEMYNVSPASYDWYIHF